MDHRQVKIYPDIESLSTAAAAFVAEILPTAAGASGSALLALSGGSTPNRLFEKLARAPHQTAVPWNQIQYFWADERCVPPENPESNYGQAQRTLLDCVAAPSANVHRMRGEGEPAAAAAEYADQLRKFAQADAPWPSFDLVLLGLGEDGHTASLFPGRIHPLEDREPVLAVQAAYQGRPASRITLTPMMLSRSKWVVYLVAGAAKAQAVKQTLQGKYDPLNCPAQRIQPIDGQVVWLLDADAASLL